MKKTLDFISIKNIFLWMILSLCCFLTLPITSQEKTDTETPAVEEKLESIELKREKLLAEEITEGEVKWLKGTEDDFLAIFKADGSGQTLGSVLVIPDIDNTPLSPGAISTTASELTNHGWHSLSLTVPNISFDGPRPKLDDEQATDTANVSESDAKTAETNSADKDSSGPEIPDENKWYTELQTKNIEKLLLRILPAESELLANGGKYILMAQGVSAELVMELISSQVIKPSGFIILNIQHPVIERQQQIAKNLAAVKVPVLDIFNTRVNHSKAMQRKTSLQPNDYMQFFYAGTDKNFRGSERQISKKIRSWLKAKFSK